jgi:hypothetical protein
LGSQSIELFCSTEGLTFGAYLLTSLDHPHQLEANNRMVIGVKRVEAQHRSEAPFNATMILFDNIIDILALTKMNAGSVLRIVVDDDSRLRLRNAFGKEINGDKTENNVRVTLN